MEAGSFSLVDCSTLVSHEMLNRLVDPVCGSSFLFVPFAFVIWAAFAVNRVEAHLAGWQLEIDDPGSRSVLIFFFPAELDAGFLGQVTCNGKLVLFFVMTITATWVLSQAGSPVLSSYGRKLCFYSCIGFLIGVSSHMLDFGIGSRPLEDAMAHTVHDLLLWTVAGLVMAWRVKPGSA